MSERFSVRLRSECDEVIYSFFDGDKPLDMDMIVGLLNEQQATINRLQSDLKDYNEIKENWDDMVELATKTSLRNVELDEQIGQLRQELNDCEKFRYTVFKRMGELNDE